MSLKELHLSWNLAIWKPHELLIMRNILWEAPHWWGELGSLYLKQTVRHLANPFLLAPWFLGFLPPEEPIFFFPEAVVRSPVERKFPSLPKALLAPINPTNKWLLQCVCELMFLQILGKGKPFWAELALVGLKFCVYKAMPLEGKECGELFVAPFKRASKYLLFSLFFLVV